ncbi:non-ribosomal peptide synthetase [Actinokineospora sp. NBRC 105648]|uniref:non-ribosomal peptide synthetase n=1 Tax=Actinokineospora sp. NBRC 105648 TaxID=3032206 RepID=UPI0024A544BA|nr:non-ribosomal peptide synthetase [Actinokineospora sp. NBRC 105648]GLZ40295.1 hypothetical protein Acsp05_39190 [Actinokineospora sp. NBRC 105648]
MDEVAIIGAAALLPGVEGLAGLHERLLAGYHPVGQPSPQRLRYTGGSPGTEYVPMGYLDRVDLFDHAFFGVSLREAELTDPHQRLVLQLAHEAVENAGYAPGELRGSRTAVILGEASSDYNTLVEGGDPLGMLGDATAALAARVSYLLDLVGPAFVVDTACSSSLTAVVHAVRALRNGEADLALAGGICVQPVLTPQRDRVPVRGLESPTGVCRPFDEDADGTVGGEGGAVVLLKPLSRALADRDNVLAVIRGAAVNHNGYRAASMGAPSQVAQAEVITEAWRDADVDPRTLGYVECHGSATPLGDVVEVDALRRAFLDAGVSTPHCSLGSVKANLGHLGGAAGVLGLVRAVSGLRHGVRYPHPHFRAPNPMIDFSGPVYVDPAAGAWPGTPRRAGLSSFGLTGTNVHAVLEQAPGLPADETDWVGPELVTVSAKSAAALDRYRTRLADFLDTTTHSLRSVAHAMNRGRDDYLYRLSFVVSDKAELAKALRAAVLPTEAAPHEPRIALLFSGDGSLEAGPDEPAATDPRGLLVRRQTELYQRISAAGITDNDFIGAGAGNLAVRVAKDELSLPDAERAAADAGPATVDLDRLREVVQSFRRDGAVFVEVGADGLLSREIARIAPDLPTIAVRGGDVLDLLARIYTRGGAIDWERHYRDARIARVEAPTYPFEPTRCWVEAPAPPPVRVDPPPRPRAPLPDVDATALIATVWQDVLKADAVDAESDYFALGGTSIAGISVLRRLADALGVELTFADLYAHRTVRSLAERVDGLRSSGARTQTGRTIAPIARGGRLPLSFGQEQLWYLDQLNPGTPLYNIPVDLRLRGPLDVDALRGAFVDLAARHEVLRTSIRSDDGEPYAHVLPAGPALPVVDLTGLPTAQRHREGGRLALAEAVRPFDLADGPLLRTTLLKLGADDHVLMYTFHHIIFDGWSPSVLFRDLFEFYRARVEGDSPDLPELPVQYADYAAWQRSWLSGERLESGLDFWRAELADLRPAELPTDRPRPPVRDFAGDVVAFAVAAPLAARAREFSKRHGVTTFVTMLALVDALLHRWAGLRDVVVGVGTSGRTNPNTHGMIGYFNNLPPFRTAVTGDLTFTELLRRCADTVAGVLDHEEMPLEKIVSALRGRRDPARQPLFDVAYTYQNAPGAGSDPAGLAISGFLDSAIGGIPPGTAKFDLTFGVTDQDDGEMFAYVEYAVALFDRDTVRGLADWFLVLLDAVLTAPDTRLDRLPDSSPARADERLVSERFAEHAAESPESTAVVSDRGVWTYRDVNRMANRLARRLVGAGVGAGSLVPVVAGRGVELVVGWLAVAKAGAAYVPVDPALPGRRIAEVLAETGATVVLGPGGLAIDIAAAAANDDENPPPRSGPRDLAYVAYTSGSTGRPHGCEVEHRNLAHVVGWYQGQVRLSAGDDTTQVASPGFDIAALEVWSPLTCGATVHFVPTVLEEPGRLLRWLADHRITAAFLPTQLAEVVLTEGDRPDDLALRVLATGGDQLRVRPPAGTPFRLLNMYGPTECTIVSTAGETRPSDSPGLPDIGRPLAGASVYIVDSLGRLAEEGEVWVGGAVVGRGYRGLPSLTATRFVADPFSGEPGARLYRTGDLGRWRADGTIEFGGRVDDQVAVRGHRVEPAEVERVLVGHPAVREAVVVATTTPGGATRLVAHVVTTGPVPDLTAWAAAALPGYMVPAEVVEHDRLPKTATGKLDRRGVKTMTVPTVSTTTADAAPAASAVSHVDITRGSGGIDAAEVLARICAGLLSLDRVSPDDNFFERGGDSVLGVRVAARAAREGVHFTPQQLLQHHTLRELAAASTVDRPAPVATAGAARPARVAATTTARTGGPIHLTPIMRAFLDRMPNRAQGFIEVQPLETTTRVDGETMRLAVEHVLARHEPMRYRFRRNSLDWRIDCVPLGALDVFDTQVLPRTDDAGERAVVVADVAELRSRIDLERGPAVRVRYYDRGHNRGGWLVFVIHHFVFDNMATVMLIDDLDRALSDLLAGRPLPTPEPLLTWREWSQHLHDMAGSDELAGELAYWTGVQRAGAATIPAGLTPGTAGTPGPLVSRTLDRAAEVLKQGRAADEAAMTAFACALARWRGTSSAYVMTEGLATPNAYRPPGRSPAVGWFTTVHPLLLPVDPAAGVLDSLPEVSDRVRSVPNDGVGYGILRHLTPHSPRVADLRSLPEPDALVLHSSHDGSRFDSGVALLRNRSDLFADVPKPLVECFPLVLTTNVVGDALRIAVQHDGRYGDVEPLADEVARAFAELA